jgi:hypothetical protein
MLAVSDCSKHIVQVIQLLEERSMSFSFCLNKADLLVLCGMTMLYQTLDLKQDSKLMKDNERLINAVIKLVEKAKAPGSYDLKRVAGMLITLDEPAQVSLPTPPRQSPDACMAAPPHKTSPSTSHATYNRIPASLGRHSSACVSETDLLMQQEKLRRMAMPPSTQNRPDMYGVRSRTSLDGGRPEPIPLGRSDHRMSLTQAQAAQAAMIARVSPTPSATAKQNLDYLSLASGSGHSQPPSPVQARVPQHRVSPIQQNHQLYPQLTQKAPAVSAAEWETLLGSLDGGQINVYDAMYGGPAISLTQTPVSSTAWSPDSFDLSHFNIGDSSNGPTTSHSTLSLSDESLSSGEDLTSSELGLSVGSLDYANSLLPVTTACTTSDGFILDGLDGAFSL